MSLSFDPADRIIVVDATLTGRSRGVGVRLALDTGATRSMLRLSILASVGCNPDSTVGRGRIRSSTGGAAVGLVSVPQLEALGHFRDDFPRLAHDPPPAVLYDGLLGLDFFRGLVLTLDFARGFASLRPPRLWWHFWR